jgi:hypothetical protein
MEKELHRNAFISTKYLSPAATADLIVHYNRKGYEIKKRNYVFIVGFLIGCTAVIVGDCLLQDCLQDILV